jgi:PAS domain S-box-containing protein
MSKTFSEETTILLNKIENRQKTLNRLSNYLSELESQLALIFATSPDIIVFLSKTGIILKISNAVQHILGYKKEEMLGQPLWNFISNDSITNLKENFALLKVKKIMYPQDTQKSINCWITKNKKNIELVWRFAVCDEREEQIIGIASNIASYKKL